MQLSQITFFCELVPIPSNFSLPSLIAKNAITALYLAGLGRGNKLAKAGWAKKEGDRAAKASITGDDDDGDDDDGDSIKMHFSYWWAIWRDARSFAEKNAFVRQLLLLGLRENDAAK